MLDYNKILLEFMKGTEVMSDVPHISLLEWNGERIKIPNECTGFVITHRKIIIDGNRTLLDENRHLTGMFSGLVTTLDELKKTQPSRCEDIKGESLGTINQVCYIPYTEEGDYSDFMLLGKSDHIVLKENLEDVLNRILLSVITINQISNTIETYSRILMKNDHK